MNALQDIKRATHRVRLLAVLVMVIALTMIGIRELAYAATWTDNMVPTSNYGPQCQVAGAVCITDNSSVTFYMLPGNPSGLESSDIAQVNSVIDGEYRPTDLALSYDATPTFSGASETDWYYREDVVSGSAEGKTVCDDPIGTSHKCDQHYITIEDGWYTYGLTCHETGHGTGLVHGDSAAPVVDMQDVILGCMRKTPPGGSGLGQNQKDRINELY
jgi:hypothetical protein